MNYLIPAEKLASHQIGSHQKGLQNRCKNQHEHVQLVNQLKLLIRQLHHWTEICSIKFLILFLLQQTNLIKDPKLLHNNQA